MINSFMCTPAGHITAKQSNVILYVRTKFTVTVVLRVFYRSLPAGQLLLSSSSRSI